MNELNNNNNNNNLILTVKNQNLKYVYPLDLFIIFLKHIDDSSASSLELLNENKHKHKHNRHINFTLNSFKKGQYLNIINEFVSSCKPYYFSSKQFYLKDNITPKQLVTIMRHIAHLHNIPYTFKRVYQFSKYFLEYVFIIEQ